MKDILEERFDKMDKLDAIKDALIFYDYDDISDDKLDAILKILDITLD